MDRGPWFLKNWTFPMVVVSGFSLKNWTKTIWGYGYGYLMLRSYPTSSRLNISMICLFRWLLIVFTCSRHFKQIQVFQWFTELLICFWTIGTVPNEHSPKARQRQNSAIRCSYGTLGEIPAPLNPALEVSHHFEIGSSFWMMINRYYEKMVQKRTYKKWWSDLQGRLSLCRVFYCTSQVQDSFSQLDCSQQKGVQGRNYATKPTIFWDGFFWGERNTHS